VSGAPLPARRGTAAGEVGLSEPLPILPPRVDTEELRDRIAEFPRWLYRFTFDGGVTTPVSSPGQINRHEQRRRYFFDALLSLTGGSLAGRRVLDLGCNAGYWSLHAVEAGAEFVLGVDAGAEYIEQARLVFEAKHVERARYRFECANVFEYPFAERFDTVLCLGMLEVVSKPVELFELISRVGAETIVVDTGVSRAASSFFEVGKLDDRQTRVDHEMVLIPTRQAVVELAAEFGYATVALAQNIADYTGMEDYESARRLAFVCSRTAPLERLAAARPESALSPWVPPALRPLLARARRG
jgi:tRNA (mo5U34)-methyltransferase